MKRLKVGIFTEVYHPTINGVVVSIDTFKTELAKLGVEYVIFTPDNPRAEREEGVIRFPALPLHPDYPPPIPFLASTFRAIARENLDMIHTQHQFMTGWFGAAAARRLGIPVITTYHTLLPEYAKTHAPFVPFGSRLTVKLSQSFCNKVDLVITPSPSIKRLLTRWGVTVPIEVNPTGIYPEKYRQSRLDLHQRFRIPPERKLLLFVGRLSDEKNVRMLLLAVRLVLEVSADVQLLLMGGGPDESAYRRLVKKLGMEDHVTFGGFWPRERIGQLFTSGDVFVYPSVTDTQAITVMEAMAAGLPMVAVDALGPGDYIKDGQTGLLTDDDAAEFSQAVLRILGNRALQERLSRRAKKGAHQFSAKKTAERQFLLYRSVLTQLPYAQASSAKMAPKP